MQYEVTFYTTLSSCHVAGIENDSHHTLHLA